MSGNIIKNHTIRALVKCVTLAYIITLISLLIFAFIVFKTFMSDDGIALGVVVIYCISNLIAGFVIGKMKKERKFMWGLLNGAIYFSLLVIISFIVNGEFVSESSMFLKALLSSTISGMIGGMLS